MPSPLKGEHAKNFLNGFLGYWVRNGYSGYHAVPDSETGEETILYITQGTADENGEWTVTYYPSAETEQEGFVVAFKAEDEGNTEDQTIPGDVNRDGVLDISNAIFLARFVAEDSTLDMSNFNVQNADINGDGLTSAADTVYIIRKIAKLI